MNELMGKLKGSGGHLQSNNDVQRHIDDYQSKLEAENKIWGDHLKEEAAGGWTAWLDHPLIQKHYYQRGLIDGLDWHQWVKEALSGPAERSLDLGCGSGSNSRRIANAGAARQLEGLDISVDRIAKCNQRMPAFGLPHDFRVADVNEMQLPANTYDLIFSCHSYHHFVNLEHINAQVAQALTPRGLFILEEFVGPTQFQWTDTQIALVRELTALIPERLRRFRWDALKVWEGRPTPEDVMAVSPFEAIRSAEILPLFEQYFEIVAVRRLGGTIQQLLYNGIMHNFRFKDDEAVRIVRAVYEVEDALIDAGLLPSDFMLLVGRRMASID